MVNWYFSSQAKLANAFGAKDEGGEKGMRMSSNIPSGHQGVFRFFQGKVFQQRFPLSFGFSGTMFSRPCNLMTRSGNDQSPDVIFRTVSISSPWRPGVVPVATSSEATLPNFPAPAG